MRFTEIPDKLKYPKALKGQISTIHSEIVTHVCDNYICKQSYRDSVIYTMNVISYLIISKDSIPTKWVASKLSNNLPAISTDALKDTLGTCFIACNKVEWDIEVSQRSASNSIEPDEAISATCQVEQHPVRPVHTSSRIKSSVVDNLQSNDYIISPTLPEHLYLNGPIVPRIDTSKVWRCGQVDGLSLVVYESLPEIPTNQSEISISTNVDMMTSNELMRLYPNQLFYTRPPELYTTIKNIEYDPIFGCILPIGKYTKKQLLDNLIKYPHLENICRLGRVDGKPKMLEFWKFIEIDGVMNKIKELWDDLPEAKVIPKSKPFIQEYVIRRYLLERDNNIIHNNKMYGDLSPFITLVMPADNYIKLGYTNTLDIAKQCVISRVAYKQSRNPVIRRLDTSV